MLQEEFLGRIKSNRILIFCIITHLKNKRKKNVVNVLDFEAELLFSVDTRNQLTNCSILDCTNFYFFSREKKTLYYTQQSLVRVWLVELCSSIVEGMESFSFLD